MYYRKRINFICYYKYIYSSIRVKKLGLGWKIKFFYYEKGGDEMVIGIVLIVLVLGFMFVSGLS